MKKILIALAAVAFSCSAMAQSKVTDSTMHKMSHNKSMHKMVNCVMMKDGKMMTMIDGKSAPMTETKTMDNGTTVTTNGTVKKTSGKTLVLKEGEWVKMTGKVMRKGDMDKMKDKKKM